MLTVPIFVSALFHSWLLCLPCSGSLVFAYTAIFSVQCLCCLVSTTSALTEVFTTSRGTRPSMLLFTASSVELGQCFHCCACDLMRRYDNKCPCGPSVHVVVPPLVSSVFTTELLVTSLIPKYNTQELRYDPLGPCSQHYASKYLLPFSILSDVYTLSVDALPSCLTNVVSIMHPNICYHSPSFLMCTHWAWTPYRAALRIGAVAYSCFCTAWVGLLC